MARLVEKTSRRYGIDGWAVQHVSGRVLQGTACTTREEAREVKRSLEGKHRGLSGRLTVTKVRITVEPVQ